MPTLLKGDRLVVSKYPYGWSWVSPSFHIFPHWDGRLLGKMPERGDIVIVTPPGQSDDYIKRVIGLPGDTIEVRGGRLIINGKPVKSERRPPVMVPVDANVPVRDRILGLPGRWRGTASLLPPADRSRDASERRQLRHHRPRPERRRQLRAGQGSGRPCVPDGRQPRPQRRQPLRLGPPENGLGGPVPWENIGGRAEFITFSLDGTSECAESDQLVRGAALGPGRDIAPRARRTRHGSEPPTVEPHVERPGPAEFRDPAVVRELKRAAVWFGLALAHRRRDRARPAVAADHRRNGLRGLPRRRRAPARPGPSDRAAASGCC